MNTSSPFSCKYMKGIPERFDSYSTTEFDMKMTESGGAAAAITLSLLGIFPPPATSTCQRCWRRRQERGKEEGRLKEGEAVGMKTRTGEKQKGLLKFKVESHLLHHLGSRCGLCIEVLSIIIARKRDEASQRSAGERFILASPPLPRRGALFKRLP